jgi:hypothetical protein
MDHHVDRLIESCNNYSLRLSSTQRDLNRAKRVIVQLHDMLVEYAAPYTTSTRNRLMFETHLDAALAAARPWIDDTSRQILTATFTLDGQHFTVQVLSNGECHLVDQQTNQHDWSVLT